MLHYTYDFIAHVFVCTYMYMYTALQYYVNITCRYTRVRVMRQCAQ